MGWPGLAGGWALGGITRMGRMTPFLGVTALGAVQPSFRVRRLMGAFTGMMLGLHQGYFTLRKFGAETLLGPAVALGLICAPLPEARSWHRKPSSCTAT